MMDHCIVCDRDAVSMVCGMPLCSKHRSQWYRHHKFDDHTIYAPNEYIMHEDYAEIVLCNSRGVDVGHALIDLDDVEQCKQYKWHMRARNYVTATIPNGTKCSTTKIHLHRLIAGCDKSNIVIDHINRNPLDNRKANLRIVSQQTNTTNNGAVGVIQVPSGRYQASVTRHYQRIYLGTYDTLTEAIAARQAFIDQYDTNDPLRVCMPVSMG